MKKNTYLTFLGISCLLHAGLALTLVLVPLPHSTRGGAFMEVTLVSSPGPKPAALSSAPATPAPAHRTPARGREAFHPDAMKPEADDPPAQATGDQDGPATGQAMTGMSSAQAPGGNTPGAPSSARQPQGTGEPSLQSYKGVILSIITKNRFYPDSARRRGIEGSVDVRFTIDKTGRASDVRVVKTSGAGVLDRASIRTIQGCSFPPPPSESITLPITITFRLVDGSQS